MIRRGCRRDLVGYMRSDDGGNLLPARGEGSGVDEIDDGGSRGIRSAIQSLEGNLPVPNIETMDQTIGASLYAQGADFAPGVNPLGVAATNGAVLTIGTY